MSTCQPGLLVMLLTYDPNWEAISSVATAGATIIALALPFGLGWLDGRKRIRFALRLINEVEGLVVARSTTNAHSPSVTIPDEYGSRQLERQIDRMQQAVELVADATGQLGTNDFNIFVSLRGVRRSLTNCIQQAQHGLQQPVDKDSPSPGTTRLLYASTNEQSLLTELDKARSFVKSGRHADNS